jgi:hypothetical protein
MIGWIKLHRQLKDNPIYKNSKAVHCWIECLLRANHDEGCYYLGRKKIVLNPGEFIMGRDEFGKSIGISGSTAWFWIERFKADSMLDIKKTSKGCLCLIKNWKIYQELDSKVDNKKTANKQQINTDNNDKNDKNENTISNKLDIEQAPVKEEYGKPEINNLLKDFEEIMGFKSASSKDRIFAKHLINNFTGEQLKTMLTYCATNTYAPRIGSLEKMWFKRGDIIAGIKSQSNKITIIN